MKTEKVRYSYIDQFRGWAVLFMIETHVLNAFLRQDLFSTSGYKIMNFINGLVAPSFLFLAGYSFTIVSLRKWDDLLKVNHVFWKQLSRYLLVLLVGYTLHMPSYSFKVLFSTISLSENSLIWGTDILHCIAMSLILMLLLLLVVRRKNLLFILLGLIGIAISFFTPSILASPIESIFPVPLAGYIKRIHYSQFPLFPWMGYVLFGAFISYLWQTLKQRKQENLFFIYGPTLSAIAIFIIGFTFWGALTFNPQKPQFFFMKLGMVVILLGFFHWLESKKQDPIPVVTLIGQESLLAYAAHIFIIYGPLWNWGSGGIVHGTGKTRSPLEIALMTLFLTIITIALCMGWHKLKQKNPRVARLVHLGMWVLIAIFFIIKTK